MNRVTVGALVGALLLAGCGGGGSHDSSDPPPPSEDYSGNFVGRWDGSSNLTLAGESTAAPGAWVPITRVGANALNVAEVCADGTGPNANVLSATSFRMSGMTCPPVAVAGCSSVSLVVSAGGTGHLSSGQLVVNITGSLKGCGQSFPLTLTFTGTRTSPTPYALTVADDAVVAADAGETVADVIASEAARLF